ncbi:multicomponent Na+:H+ antiporter subunit C [Geosporobacter subterraneus DSM 17957]|uniref:Multicomponent Na+:H+ antiporter subunit C n=1 Tax=Geosporobacter subterraneus DSM 17957 TaxID=1121919 RepID=A0A1M6N7S3_9FIRM|nr:cation:proton antiporter subunit C [Geosporobacter subterraneus]SHJ91743.1 multicomponent Na+:H+ antiporter subunit C [Geosporobacter subterraneus DSM 17957]
MIDQILCFILLLISFYGLCTQRNIIKSIIFLNIAEVSVILLILSISSVPGREVPILPGNTANMVDPLPQALMITTIVVGLTITALALMLAIKLFHYYGTLDWNEILER